jgi:hypothetical protein
LSSNSTKIPYLAYIIQLVIKAILGAFNIKPIKGEDVDDEFITTVNTSIIKSKEYYIMKSFTQQIAS